MYWPAPSITHRILVSQMQFIDELWITWIWSNESNINSSEIVSCMSCFWGAGQFWKFVLKNLVSWVTFWICELYMWFTWQLGDYVCGLQSTWQGERVLLNRVHSTVHWVEKPRLSWAPCQTKNTEKIIVWLQFGKERWTPKLSCWGPEWFSGKRIPLLNVFVGIRCSGTVGPTIIT